MTDYAVRTNNLFANLLGNQQVSTSSKKKNKKKKKPAEPTAAVKAPIPSSAAPAAVSDVAVVDDDGFVEPSKNLKAKKRREKKKEAANAPAADAKAAPEPSPSPSEEKKHVSFTSSPHSPRPEGNHQRRSSLKSGTIIEQGSDTGIVKELAKLGYSVSSIIECMDQLEQDGQKELTAPQVLQELQKLSLSAALKQATPAASASAAPTMNLIAPSATEPAGKKDKKEKKKAESKAAPAAAAPAAAVRPAEHKHETPHLTLAERTEHQAHVWDPATPEGLQLVEKWSSMLDKGEKARKNSGVETEGDVLFWNAFLNSRALEELVTKVLHHKGNLPGKVEAAFSKILNASLFGDVAYHKWLLTQLYDLSRSFETCADKDFLISKVLFLITNQKQGKLAHASLSEISAADSSKTHEKKSAPAPKAQVKDPLSELQEAGDDAALSFTLKQDSLKQLHSSASKVLSADQLTNSFRALERDIQSHINQSRSEIADLQQQRENIISKKDGLDSKSKQELNRLGKEQQDVMREKLLLEERRNELLREVEKLDRQIKDADTKLTKNGILMSELQNTHSSSTKNLQQLDAELSSRITSLGKADAVSHRLSKFIEDVRSRVKDSSNKDHNQLETAFKNSSRQYVQQLDDFIGKHEKWVNFLKDRAAFCTEKLEAAKTERKKREALGIPVLDQKSEKDFSDLIQQDQSSIQRIIVKVNASVVAASRIISETGINTDSNSGYGAFLQRAKTHQATGKFPFNLSSLPEVSQPAASAPAASAAAPAPSHSTHTFSAPARPAFSSTPSMNLFANTGAVMDTVHKPRSVPLAPTSMPIPSVSVPISAPSAPAPASPAAAPSSSSPSSDAASPTEASSNASGQPRRGPVIRGANGSSAPRSAPSSSLNSASIALMQPNVSAASSSSLSHASPQRGWNTSAASSAVPVGQSSLNTSDFPEFGAVRRKPPGFDSANMSLTNL